MSRSIFLLAAVCLLAVVIASLPAARADLVVTGWNLQTAATKPADHCSPNGAQASTQSVTGPGAVVLPFQKPNPASDFPDVPGDFANAGCGVSSNSGYDFDASVCGASFNLNFVHNTAAAP